MFTSWNRPRRPRGGSRGIAYSFFNLGARWGGWSTTRPGRFAPKEREEAGWAPGLIWTGAEYLAPTGIRSPDHPARNKSLYRLRYPGPPTPNDSWESQIWTNLPLRTDSPAEQQAGRHTKPSSVNSARLSSLNSRHFAMYLPCRHNSTSLKTGVHKTRAPGLHGD